MIDAMEQHLRNRRIEAIRASGVAQARVAGMKIRARLEPPRAAPAHFPYAHRDQRQVAKARGERRKS